MLEGLQTVCVSRSAPSRYAIVSVDEATAMTGLELAQLLTLPGTQLLDRSFADGRSERALRLPAELASAHPVPAPAVSRLTTAADRPTSEQVRNRSALRESRH
jgi:hypothetical protein